MAHFVYILECINGSFYTGYTTDVKRRYQEHQSGSLKCRYTRSFPPIALRAFWQFASLSDALVVEKQIKSLTRTEKIDLIARWQPDRTPHLT